MLKHAADLAVILLVCYSYFILISCLEHGNHGLMCHYRANLVLRVLKESGCFLRPGSEVALLAQTKDQANNTTLRRPSAPIQALPCSCGLSETPWHLK